MTACLLVRARIIDVAVKDAFDRWYHEDHLPRAQVAFGAARAWRAWSETDPLVHYAFYEYDDSAELRRLMASEVLRGFVAEFDRAWGDKVIRERDCIEVMQTIGTR